ncbi:unnamed protein product [Rotaria sp. Silwood1]|nr:unnamed protein product [Rotaria sp. Silwood1]CAF4713146.1 unnamed protein product [Rotaria sp. Silwood1]
MATGGAGNSNHFHVEQLNENIFEYFDIDIVALNQMIADFHNDLNQYNININDIFAEIQQATDSAPDNNSADQQQQQQNTQVSFRLIIPRCVINE